jgi:hypothetical protein
MKEQLHNDRLAALPRQQSQVKEINYSWIKSANGRLRLGESQMLVINILNVCSRRELWRRAVTHYTRCFISHSAKNYTRPSPPVFHRWTGKVATVSCVKWRLKWRCCQRHVTQHLRDKDSVRLLTSSSARNELSFPRVKIKFMIRRKQTSIWLSTETLSFDRAIWQDSWSTWQSFALRVAQLFSIFSSTSFMSFICQFRYSVPKNPVPAMFMWGLWLFFGHWNFFTVNLYLPSVNPRTTKYYGQIIQVYRIQFLLSNWNFSFDNTFWCYTDFTLLVNCKISSTS